ncbi:MAG: glycosyltransferase family 4 protein [Actinomycetota bacterium]|nr:glycosyltransferase family 4 protein [Actinomycetota bacterium]
MQVLVLAQYYAPEPVPKPAEVAEELTRRGHSVTVLTGFPNYPSGALAAGYRLGPFLREVIHGVPVLRVFEVPYHGRSAFWRSLNYLSFDFAAAMAAYAIPRPDIIYVFLPPLTVGVSAWLLSALRRTPFVCDLQDIWPDEAIMSGMMREGLISRSLRVLERFVYSRASHLLVITEEARDNILQKGVADHRISVLPHWYPAEQSFEQPPRAEVLEQARRDLRAGDQFVVTFAGNLGLVQGLSTVLEAASRLRSRSDIAFRFIGDGSDRQRLERMARELKLETVAFLGQRPSVQMAPLLAASDALLVQAAPGPLNQLLLPTKTLAYLAAGRPVIAAMDGATATLIREADAGLTVPPGDPVALANAIQRLAGLSRAQLADMGRRGRRFVAERFDKSRIMDRLEAVLTEHARA